MRALRPPVGSLLVGLAIALAAPAATEAAAPAADPPSLAAIEEKVMCTVCGVPLSMAREAPAAKRQRVFIQELIAQGLTEPEIEQRLVNEYGKGVLIEPRRSGFDLTAWLVPALGFLAAALLLVGLLLRWRNGGTAAREPSPAAVGTLSPEDAELVDEALRERN